MTVVLAEEDEHGLIEHMDVAEGGLLGRLTLVMDNMSNLSLQHSDEQRSAAL